MREPAHLDPTTSLRKLLSWILWPALVVGGVVAVQVALRNGVAAPAALGALQILAVVVIAVLEHWMPEHIAWNVPRGDIRTDAVLTVCSGLLISGMLRMIIFSATPSLALWPAALPVFAQLALALALADFGSYATHVATHRLNWLWPIHAPHHSSLRLYWLNTSRMHPLDTANTLLWSLLPLALLGAPATVLALFDSFAMVHLMLQHSNIRLRHGPLSHLVATAEFHRWHHASERVGGESNYASFFSLWDHLFGTFRMPAMKQLPDNIGLYDGTILPRGWRDLLLHPFRVWRARDRHPGPDRLPGLDAE